MKTEYVNEVEDTEDNQNVSLPCIILVPLYLCMVVAMATVLPNVFFFYLYALIIL